MVFVSAIGNVRNKKKEMGEKNIPFHFVFPLALTKFA